MKNSLPIMLAALLGMTACGESGPVTSTGSVLTHPALLTATFAPLKAQRGDRPGIYDSEGRFVLLRGVNYTALGDYYIHYPESPAPLQPQARDFAEMAALGLNMIRLIVHWSALEPAPGQYDLAYIARIREQVERAAAQGLYVMLDMHQDAWGKFISTRDTGDAALCLPPFSQAVGWDGAPQWATLTDGLTSCRVAQRELSPAVAQAFTNFYTDRDGIQTRYIAMWQRLVTEFAPYRNIAGYDLFNEPHPGYQAGGNIVLLSQFYGRLIEAIRSAERATPGGLEHTVFFEPSIEWSLLGETPTVPATFTADTNLVFAPHNYCGTFNPLPASQCFQNAQRHADDYGITFWSGEWGFYGDLATAAPLMVGFAALEDQYKVGGAFWVWSQACGDPHSLQPLSPTAGGIGAIPAETVSVKRMRCPGDIDQGFVSEYTLPLSRAYPRAAPGTLLTLTADVAKGSLALTGSTASAGKLEVWLPERLGTPKPVAQNLRAITTRRVAGGYRLDAIAEGEYALRVE